MEKSTSPDGSNASKSPWPGDSSSEQNVGATGVFEVVKVPQTAAEPAAGSAADRGPQSDRAMETAKSQPAIVEKAFAEPVVHRVVVGGGPAAGSTDVLDRMRLASAEGAPVVMVPPGKEPILESAPMNAEGSGGFTQLLQKLDSLSPLPAASARETPSPEVRTTVQDSGFTSLLRTLGPSESTAVSAEPPRKNVELYDKSASPDPGRASAASAPGGFTDLLRAMPPEGSELSRAPQATPAQIENKPGAFTQMLSVEQQSSLAKSAFREERSPETRNFDYGLTPGATGATGPVSRGPFSSSPLPEAQPPQSVQPASGVGITRLIQMLDGPSKTPAQRAGTAAENSPSGVESTQTFASASTPGDTSQVQAPFAASRTPMARESEVPSGWSQPPVNTLAASTAAAGPSEFTRILDASRMREQAMRSGQVPGASSSTPAAQPQNSAPALPVPPPVSMPTYPPPPAFHAGGIQGGALPQPGGYAAPQPPHVPNYPMNFGSHAGAIPAPGVNLPQAPGMYVPPPPASPAPPAPPAKPSPFGMGNMQPLVPLLLIVIIVLLVALLVTVIFSMKH